MAQATVAIKVTTTELVTLIDALKMYAHVCRNVETKEANPLKDFSLDLTIHGDQPRIAAMRASNILKDIQP
jgi:hypothetical protein